MVFKMEKKTFKFKNVVNPYALLGNQKCPPVPEWVLYVEPNRLINRTGFFQVLIEVYYREKVMLCTHLLLSTSLVL